MDHSSPEYPVNGGAAAAAVALPPLHTTVPWAESKHHNPLTVMSTPSSSSSPPGGATTPPTPATSETAPRGGEVAAAAAAAAGCPPPAALDWETYKDTIKDLYMGQNLNLNQVVDRMKAYDFHATPRMYKAQFARWGWSKYNCKRMRRDISSGKAVEKSVGKSCHRIKRQRASKTGKGKGSSSTISNSSGGSAGSASASGNNTTLASTSTTTMMTTTTNTAMSIVRRPPGPQQLSVTSYQIAHANDPSRYIQAILSDIRGHVYSFFSRKPDWQKSPGTGLISAYNYSFYDSFRIALDSFLKNEHFNGGEILRQAFVEAEEAIQTDYSSTFYFFFIDLPDLFLHYGRHDIFVILLQHINRLTAVSLRDKIVGAGFASLLSLAKSNPAFLRYYIAAASGLWCDLLKELRGPSDRSTLLARRNHIRHSRTADRHRVRDLCDDYDRLLGEVKNRWGAGHNASRHLEDVILLTQLNYGHYMDGFAERNERLIEDVGRKYQLASSATARSPVSPVSIESHKSSAGDGKFETLPLEAWDIIDRNIRSNCYHRLACYYIHQGGGADRASLCSRKAREGWKTNFWQLEVEGALVDSGRLFEADTLRRCRLEAQYFKKLPENDWSIAAAELDYYLNIRPSLLRTMAPTAGGAWAPSLGYGNMPGTRQAIGS